MNVVANLTISSAKTTVFVQRPDVFDDHPKLQWAVCKFPLYHKKYSILEIVMNIDQTFENFKNLRPKHGDIQNEGWTHFHISPVKL